MDDHDLDHTSRDADGDALPGELELELLVRDPDVIEALVEAGSDRERHRVAITALRIGVMAMRQAAGAIDATAVRSEGERVLTQLASALTQHKSSVAEQVSLQLKTYFDPSDGHFHDRVRRLVAKDGELESTLRALIGREDSELVKTLSAHLGSQSPLMQLLDPQAAEGLVQAIEGRVSGELETQRERILEQFSLDDDQSALSRLVSKLEGNTANVVREFSLDHEDSALSRLMRGVENAQRQISQEFSLDAEGSALARMKKEMLEVLAQQSRERKHFEVEVRAALEAMQARKEEREQGTRHGGDFEGLVVAEVETLCHPMNDVVVGTGNTTGKIRNCKVGDCVITLGPEHAAAGARVVVEAKQDASYNLQKALAELDTALDNRDARVGVFVFSRKTAPESLPAMRAYGHKLVVVWDAEDPHTDLVLEAALFAARSMAAALHREGDADEAPAELDDLEASVLAVEKEINRLDDLETWSKSIDSANTKIADRVRILRNNLTRSMLKARAGVDALKR